MQAGSDAIFSPAASAWSLPAHLHAPLGLRIYRALERVAPAPYVEAMLAREALARGDLDAATRHAKRMPRGAQRAEYLAQIARARGDEPLAQREYLAAGDFFAITDEVTQVAARDPLAAYALEDRLRRRLTQLTTHPDAVAESWWRMGQLATLVYYARGHSRAWVGIGMGDYRRAIALAPLSEKYLLAAGSQSLLLGQPVVARAYYLRALAVAPGSLDASKGLRQAAEEAKGAR